jgi:hypothetical protein
VGPGTVDIGFRQGLEWWVTLAIVTLHMDRRADGVESMQSWNRRRSSRIRLRTNLRLKRHQRTSRRIKRKRLTETTKISRSFPSFRGRITLRVSRPPLLHPIPLRPRPTR